MGIISCRTSGISRQGMDNMNTLASALVVLALGLVTSPAKHEMDKTIAPDLSRIVDGKTWKIDGRTVTTFEREGKKAARFDERTGYGLAFLPGTEFGDGTIEF